jgi:predicted RNase H-like HicB family nuclease
MADTRHVTAIIEREGDWYVALCPDYDIASQGRTVEEARRNLAEAVELFLECADSAEVERRLRREVFITQIEVAGA